MKAIYSLLRKFRSTRGTLPAAAATTPDENRPCHAQGSVLPFVPPASRRSRIEIRSENGTELQTGVEHTFTAHYPTAGGSADGQLLAWSASSPSVIFDPPYSYVVNGLARTTAMRPAELGGLLNVTIIATASHPDGRAGTADRGRLPGIHFHDVTEMRTWAYYHVWMMNPYFG
jgi:hypothetical protein